MPEERSTTIIGGRKVMDSLNPDILKNHIPNKHFTQEELDILKFLIVDKNMSPYEINKKYPNISPPPLYQREKK